MSLACAFLWGKMNEPAPHARPHRPSAKAHMRVWRGLIEQVGRLEELASQLEEARGEQRALQGRLQQAMERERAANGRQKALNETTEQQVGWGPPPRPWVSAALGVSHPNPSLLVLLPLAWNKVVDGNPRPLVDGRGFPPVFQMGQFWYSPGGNFPFKSC